MTDKPNTLDLIKAATANGAPLGGGAMSEALHRAAERSMEKFFWGGSKGEKPSFAGKKGIGAWDAADHPRDAAGRFTEKGGDDGDGVGNSIMEDIDKGDKYVDKLVKQKKISKEDGAYLKDSARGIANMVLEDIHRGGEDKVTSLRIWHNWVRGAKFDLDGDGKIEMIYNNSDEDLDDSPKAKKADVGLPLSKRFSR